MCGRKSKIAWVGLCLLLAASSVSFSDVVYDGPILPAGWYPIHETEILQIEEELMKQERALTALGQQLDDSDLALNEAELALNTSTRAVGRLETSLRQLGREARLWRIAAILAVPISVGLTIGAFLLF